MTGPAYRRAARFFFEPAPRTAMAHPEPFRDMAHELPRPEPLWVDIFVFLIGIPLIAILVLVFLGGPG